MGRLNNALTMLLLLRSRQKMSRKELAEALEVDIRQISRYKDDLCAAGIWIEEERGRYGGYSLKGPAIWFDVELNDDEIKALELAIKCTNIGTFPLKMDFYSAIIKILSKYNFDNYWHNNTAAQHRRISKYTDELKDKWIDINECIIQKRKIKIDYCNMKGERMIRKVHPYAIYVYEDANYMVAYCEYKKSIRNFKLIRIKKIVKCDEAFEKDGFDMKMYLRNRLGTYSDDREFEVTLKVYYPYAKCFKEHKWVHEEELIDKYEEGYIIYNGHIQGKRDIIKWVMEMGSSAEVIAPLEIREAVTDELNKTISNYN